MTVSSFSQCSYSAFLSYAHADDEAWRNWVSDFCYELDHSLEARVSGTRVPRAHLSSKNGPIHGPLNGALRSAIEQSFAMIVFVHDNYLTSEWCLQELRHFKALAGEEGFRDRLYIIALSEQAIEALTARESWRQLFSQGDQVWMKFFKEDASDQPIDIYTTDPRRNRKIVVSTDFWDGFIKIREDLAAKMRRAHQREAAARTYPEPAAAPVPLAASVAAHPDDGQMVRVYIEGNATQEQFWEPLGLQIVASWDQVAAEAQCEPPLLLRPTGLDMNDIDSRPMLDDADGVVLLWARKTPDSVVAQIGLVEPKLSGPNIAPGLVAYLMDSMQDVPVIPTINNWPVVRFLTRADGSATVLASDAPLLANFVREVLQHKRRLG